ncbi:MAG: lipoate-protein ligase [Frankiales bacterium]|nr:lipoate-protein ligase [Frankiales bacterium]
MPVKSGDARCRRHAETGAARTLDRVSLTFVRAGFLPYDEAWAWQRDVHARRVADAAPDTVLLVEHEPVYTAGRRTNSWERPTDGSRVVDVDRGGRITWHGPGQLTGYPIVKLPPMTDTGRAGIVDVVAYVRRLEDALMRVCSEYGLETARVADKTGVWIAGTDRKVAAIGVRVARGVTMHGFALNCANDMGWYDRIVACGLPEARSTSLSIETGRHITVDDVLPLVERHLADVLGSDDALESPEAVCV